MLEEARGSGVPVLMRNGAENAEAALTRLVKAREALEHSAGKKERELLNRAELDELALRTSIAKLRLQATDIETAQHGPLGKLPQGELMTSPDAVRRQAIENVPPGLCDDALMEGTIACPLDDKLRSSNRHFVEQELNSIAANWRHAIQKVESKARFKQLAKKDDGAAIRDMLLGLALGWLGGSVIGAAVSKLGALKGTQHALADAAMSLKDLKSSLSKLGQKGGEAVAKKLPAKAQEHDNLDALSAGFVQLANEWQRHSSMAVRHLPDAALTALAAGLKVSPLTAEYFVERLQQLMNRYDELEETMGKSGFSAVHTSTCWVVHPHGGGRMALVREEDSQRWVGHGKARDVIAEKTGRFIFISWIDHSLESVALDIGRQKGLVTTTALTTTDARWADASVPALAAWHADVQSRDDVAIFSDEAN
jgi:hypothetical protein